MTTAISTYSCVLFDLDNTLIDTAPLVRASLACCGCKGVAAVPDRDLRCSPPYELLQRLERPDAKNDYWRHYKQLERPGAVDGRSDRLGPSATPEA